MTDLLIPSMPAVVALAQKMEFEREKSRLDFLSDPKNVFGYNIRADGTCLVGKPVSMLAPNLRKAIDYLLEHPEKQKRT
jgi:hypothetical protein